MMTREEAIRNIERFRDGLDSLSESTLIQILDIAIEALEQTQWIPCSERLPKIEENPVLVTSMGMVGMGWYRNGDWLTSTNLPFFDVVAWMPLPKPYRGDDHEE
jgi:hypothetical protein